jgi:hypothetical protein
MNTHGNPAPAGPELDALAACLADTALAEDSPRLDEFERRLSDLGGLEEPALATTSASAAMQLALAGLEVKPGERVVVSTLCGIRFVNPVIHLGARPLLLDVEPEGLSLDPELLARFLGSQCLRRGGAWFEREGGRRLAAVILPWLGGLVPRRDEIHQLCRRHGLHLIELPESPFQREDAQAPADARVLDFSRREPGLGGGGALLSPHAGVIRTARWWAGLCRPAGEQGPRDFGFQYRMPALLAALGNARLEVLQARALAGGETAPCGLAPRVRGAGLPVFGPAVFRRPGHRAWRIPEGGSFAACLELLFPHGWTAERLPRPLHRQELYGSFLHGQAPVAEAAWESTLVARPLSGTHTVHTSGAVEPWAQAPVPGARMAL